ncbi:MAG: hypothetical protein VX833_00345 [Actinomycetota bacterium]|nr:hypothetical protein [Actinomycetota bacterium]
MKRYATIVLSMSLALAATGLVAGTDSASPTNNGRDVPSTIEGWTPQVESYVARLVASGVPSSGECPLSA